MDKEELKLKYDEQCKKILCNSKILSYILKASINEYRSLTVDEIEELINKDEHNNIIFENVEDIKIDNRKVFYDIFIKSRLPNNNKIGILIDLEPQSSIDNSYPIINRALSYSSHLLLSQKKKKPLYSDLDKVYSIWICSDTNSGSKTDIFTYGLNRASMFNSRVLNEDYRLINVVCVYLGKDLDEIINNKIAGPYTDLLKILRLTIIRGSKLDDPKTQKTLEIEYNITIAKEDIKNMCNLSEAFEYDCIQEGKSLGLKQGLKQGTIDALSTSVNNLINNLKITYKEAVNILNIDSTIKDEVHKAYIKKYEN